MDEYQGTEDPGEGSWIYDFFNQTYLDTYVHQIPEQRTNAEVNFIESIIGPSRHLRILDLACGIGRHAVELACRGYDKITGLDFNPEYLRQAQSRAEQMGAHVKFVSADMRSIESIGEFDFVFNFFSSLFYFSDEVNQDILSRVGQALSSGGRFLIQDLHLPAVFSQFLHNYWSGAGEGPWNLNQLDFDPHSGRIINRQRTVYPDGRIVSRHHSGRVYLLTELRPMIERAGMAVEETWGGIDGSPLRRWSDHLVVLARKAT